MRAQITEFILKLSQASRARCDIILIMHIFFTYYYEME